MENISIQELVAVNNTPKAKALIVKYGYEPAKNYDDLLYKLFVFTKEHKEDALKELANIHPDKELILNYFSNEEKCDCRQKIKNILSRYKNEKKSRFDYADDYIDVEGSGGNKKQLSNNIAILVGLGIFTVFLTVMSKSK